MNDEQLLRYSRQIMLPQVDIRGQEKLMQATALVVGVGGLGSPAAMYLAAAGVGHLVLCDFDTVDLSNLQRQVLHGTDNIGQAKVLSAQQRLQALNPEVKVTTVNQQLDHDQLTEWGQRATVVLDCTDNLNTRMLINEVCVQQRKPLIYGAAIRMEGQLSVFHNELPDSPCYRCLYPSDQALAESCTQTGVLAPVVGVIGSLQALEAMKVIMGIGDSPIGRLQLLDALHMEWCEMKLVKNPDCPVCGQASATPA